MIYIVLGKHINEIELKFLNKVESVKIFKATMEIK
jgi:hypothetical protein